MLPLRPKQPSDDIQECLDILTKVVYLLHVDSPANSAQLPALARLKFSQTFVAIGISSTNDSQSLETLRKYDADCIVQLVEESLHKLEPAHDTSKHHIALIRSVIALSTDNKDYRRSQLLDTERTFQQNRQIYLRILGIDLVATCVDIAELSECARGCKIFQEQPDVYTFRQLLHPYYLPIRPQKCLPWEIARDVTCEEAGYFTAFISQLERQLGHIEQDHHDILFIIYQRSRRSDSQFSKSFLDHNRDFLRHKIRVSQAPHQLVVYIVAAVVLHGDYSLHTIDEFMNNQAINVSPTSITSFTRALKRTSLDRPGVTEKVLKLLPTLLGDNGDVYDDTYIRPDLDEYWLARIKDETDHHSAWQRYSSVKSLLTAYSLGYSTEPATGSNYRSISQNLQSDSNVHIDYQLAPRETRYKMWKIMDEASQIYLIRVLLRVAKFTPVFDKLDIHPESSTQLEWLRIGAFLCGALYRSIPPGSLPSDFSASTLPCILFHGIRMSSQEGDAVRYYSSSFI